MYVYHSLVYSQPWRAMSEEISQHFTAVFVRHRASLTTLCDITLHLMIIHRGEKKNREFPTWSMKNDKEINKNYYNFKSLKVTNPHNGEAGTMKTCLHVCIKNNWKQNGTQQRADLLQWPSVKPNPKSNQTCKYWNSEFGFLFQNYIVHVCLVFVPDTSTHNLIQLVKY